MYFDFLDTYFNSPDYEIIQILREYAISISDISLIDFLISFSISDFTSRKRNLCMFFN